MPLASEVVVWVRAVAVDPIDAMGGLARRVVGPAIWQTFLPSTLADGRYRASPEPTVVGHGLEVIPAALTRLREGVRAGKLVVTL